MSKQSLTKEQAKEILASNRSQGVSDQQTYEELSQQKAYDFNPAYLIATTLTSQEMEHGDTKKVLKNAQISTYIFIALYLLGSIVMIRNLANNSVAIAIIVGIIVLIIIAFMIEFAIKLKNDPYHGLSNIIILSTLFVLGNWFSQDWIGFIVVIGFFAIMIYCRNRIFPHLTIKGGLKKDQEGKYIFPH